MKVTIRTPNHTIFDGFEAIAVTLPGGKGDLQILNNHAPILSNLRKGVLKVKSEGDVVELALDEGFFIFSENILDIVIFKTQLSDSDLQAIEDKAISLRNKQLNLDESISEKEFIEVKESEQD